MKIKTELEPSVLPSLIGQVAGIAGWEVWKNRVETLRLLARDNPLWPEFMFERHSLELAFFEAHQHVRKTGRCAWPPRNDQEYRLYSFVAIVAQVHARLGASGKSRLSGAIRSGLEKEFGLGPFAFEMKTAAHLLSRGFDIDFHDLENGGGYDFLATSDNRKFEVECKHLSADLGRKIPRRRLYEFAGAVSSMMRLAVDQMQGGFHLRVEIPDRLDRCKEQQRALAAQIKRVLSSQVALDDETCSISFDRFDIISSLFSAERGKTLSEADIRAEFCKINGVELDHSLFAWRPGKAAVIISFKSRKKDNVLAKILDRLKEDAKRQFTGELPAFMFVHMADLNERQLLDLVEEDNSGSVTGIRIAISELLRKRPHVHTIALMTDGSVQVKRSQTVTATQERGPSYVFRNPVHPRANDPVLDGVFAP